MTGRSGPVAADPIRDVDLDQELVRLRKRVERERAARLEAEAIAECGLRSLYEINQDLDRRVQEGVAESRQLARQAERAERVKSELLANLSHELRTPLMAVVGSLDLLQARGGHNTEANAEVDAEARYLAAAIEGAGRLRDLVDELFEIVSLEGGSTTAERSMIDVRSLVEEVGAHWRMAALKKGLLLVTSVDSGHPFTVDLDVARTGRALDRLIDNAVKYSISGTVTVAVEAKDLDATTNRGGGGGEVCFTVRDEGPGIESGRLARILEPFEIGDRSSTRTVQGAGLGLALAQGLAEMMDGRLSIDSEVGMGTAVSLSLPFGCEPFS